jgi:uncharacterized protein (TIGR02117 family)
MHCVSTEIYFLSLRMRILKKAIKAIFLSIAFLLSCLFLYFLFALILTIIPVNNSFTQTEKGIKIFVRSNGVHTDLVLPVKNNIHDWTKKIDPEDFETDEKIFSYVSFGWGDKGFYLNTPTWAELKFNTAFNAMFLGGASCMHVSYETDAPALDKNVREIAISKEQYSALVRFIDASFQKDSNGNYMIIPGHHYSGTNDCFYNAIGSYSFYKTCNEWTNRGLKAAGIKTAAWAPFDESVLYHLK